MTVRFSVEIVLTKHGDLRVKHLFHYEAKMIYVIENNHYAQFL